MSAIVFLAAMLVVGCAGGGGSEVGNGGDRESVVVEHGLDFAKTALARLSSRDRTDLVDGADDERRLRAWIPRLVAALRDVEVQRVEKLPPFCRCETMACAKAGDKSVYVEKARSERLRDYREAAALLWHEAVHLAGEARESEANQIAVLLTKAWRKLGHPEAPHWLAVAEAPLARERITDDRDLLRYQYSDWSGDRLVVWDERSIQKYDPATDRWELAKVPKNPLAWRRPQGKFAVHAHAWAWVNGHGAVLVPCRTLYPALKEKNAVGVKLAEKSLEWSTITATDAPSERMWTSVARSSDRLFLWGGAECAGAPVALGDGAAYDPAADRWERFAAGPDAPTARYAHTMLWTGKELVVWGGFAVHRADGKAGVAEAVNTGAFYDPKARRWTPMAVTADAPSPRIYPRLAWSGRELYVFGGFPAFHGKSAATGAAYDPATRQWRKLPDAAPETQLASVEPAFTFWTGSQLAFVAREHFAFFDPTAALWAQWGRPALTSPSLAHRLYWTGVEAIVWDPEERRGVRLYP